jgi:hypothetical protein
VNKQSVREALSELAESSLPQTPDLWPSIQARIGTAKSSPGYAAKAERPIHAQTGPSRPLSRPRFVNTAAVLVAATALMGLLLVVARNEGFIGAGVNVDPSVGYGPYGADRRAINGYTVTIMQSYAQDGRMQIVYNVARRGGDTLPLYRLYQDGMHVYYQADVNGTKGLPRLTDETGNNYSYLDMAFAWSKPTRPEEQTPVSDIASHQGVAACCLGRADQIVLYFSPGSQDASNAAREMHLDVSVFLPEDVLTPVARGSSSGPDATLTPLGYTGVVDARFGFDFPLAPRPGTR